MTSSNPTQDAKQQMLINKLREVLARMEIAAMMSSDPMVWTDNRGRIEWCNTNFEDLLETPKTELIGQPIIQALPLYQKGIRVKAKEHPATLALQIDDYAVGTFDYYRGGEKYRYDISYAPILPSSSPSGSSSVLVLRRIESHPFMPKDLLETAVAERLQSLTQENDVLKEQVRDLASNLGIAERAAQNNLSSGYQTKNAFLANMTHELRTPLSAIMGYADLLQRDLIARGHVEWAKDVFQIRKASDKLFFMINQLLDVAEIEENQSEFNPMSFMIPSLIHDVRRTAREYMDEQENTLHIDIEEGIEEIYTDEPKLRKVILQLLSNAAKFTVQGDVTLRIKRETRDERPWITFTVIDTGIGMTSEQTTRIFDAFTQADESLTRRYEGGGVGLYICDQFVKLMGGSIEVESEPGKGSTFRVFIPDLEPELLLNGLELDAQ